jgi:hypothetical protein
MVRELKILERTFTLSASQFGIKECCLIWFYCVDGKLRSTIPEYSETMTELSNNQGIILCPNCVIKKLKL